MNSVVLTSSLSRTFALAPLDFAPLVIFLVLSGFLGAREVHVLLEVLPPVVVGWVHAFACGTETWAVAALYPGDLKVS